MKRALVALLLLALGACAATPATGPPRRTGTVAPPPRRGVERGKASYYAKRFHGRKTASGERFDVNAMTAAHRKLPFGTRVRVTNLENGLSVVVWITDRGPYGRGRVIDLSPAAARRLDMMKAGLVPVTVEVLALPPCAMSAGKTRC